MVLSTLVGLCGLGLSAAAASQNAGAHAAERMRPIIERQTFAMLRASDQDAIARRARFSPLLGASCRAGGVTRSTLRSLPARQRAMLEHLAQREADGRLVPAMCYAPETEPAVVAAFEQFRRTRLGDRQDRFFQVPRWDSTASSTGPFNQGDPTVLTYSFVPDGTIVPDFNATAPSELFSFLNGIYGSPAVWQALYAQMFARWAELCGTSYIFEPNDDGAAMDDPGVPASGILGVRGDCRMAGTFIDGPSNILAFNYFPAPNAGGDMVIDTGDTFYNDTSNNSIRLLNVLWHEHGHGLGMAHVCPRTNSKLMEPFISTVFNGPQIDDILNAQRHYGDNNEPNDTSATSTPVPALTTPQTFAPVSIDNDTDQDSYLVIAPSLGVTSVAVAPLGGVYADSPQDPECTAQGFSEPGTFRQLTIDARDAASGSLLASWTNPQRGPISAAIPTRAGQGVRFVVRGTVTSTDAIQAYSITFSHQSTNETIVIDWPTALLQLSTSQTTMGSEVIRIRSHTGLSGTPQLTFSLSGPGSQFSSFPLTQTGATTFSATLPRSPLCADGLFRIEATGPDAGTITFPGPTAQSTLQIITGTMANPFFDDFESDLGWTYGAQGDTATSGQWIRGDPVGTSGQAENPFSGITCAFTGQHTLGQAVGFNDVDSGFTTLVSPIFSTAGLKQPRINYRRWFSNSAGSAPFSKAFTAQVSSDGGATWTTLEVVGPTGEGTVGGWVPVSLPLPPGVASTASMRVRFRADDAGPGSLIEAGIDDFAVVGFACTPGLVSDINNSGAITTQDIFDFLNSWFSGNILADVTGDSGITVQDIFTFLNAWFAQS